MARVIEKDLDQIKKEYGRPRRTSIENAQEIVFEEKKIEEMDVVFLMDRFGYAKLIDMGVYERNKEAAHGDYKYVFICKNTDKICIFTDQGQMHTVKALDVPLCRLRDKGTPIDNLCNYSSAQEELVYIGSLESVKQSHLLFVTAKGMAKQVDGMEFDVAKRTVAATKLTEGDRVVLVQPADAMEYLVLQSRQGYFLRFLKEEIPEKKKTAIGVRAMRLGQEDEIAHAYLLESRMEYAIDHGSKKLVLNKLKLSKRDGKGTKVRG